MPVAAPVLYAASARVAAWIGSFTLLPCLFAVGFLWMFTAIVAARTTDYYRAMDTPPSFRHMDPMDLQRVLVDYLEAHDAGPDTVLVLGDCVAFGHGVTTPFPSMLSFPGYRVLNVSMQSFRYDLMLVVIQEALNRGVKHVIVQLHPFEDYRAEAAQWRHLRAQRTSQQDDDVAGVDVLPATELVADARANWPVIALAIKEGTDRFYDYSEHLPTGTLSSWLRYRVLSAWPLYRNRFAFDDWSGLKLSYYTERTHRQDSYVATLPDSQQQQIFADQAPFFARFAIADRDAYVDSMTRYSGPARAAAVLQSAGADALFVMAPTFVDKIDAHTALHSDDLAFASDTMRRIVTARGFAYIDYLRDPELDAEMVHFDNLTAKGQQLLGRKLALDLVRASFPRAAEISSTR